MNVWTLKNGDFRQVVRFETDDPTAESSGGELDVYSEFLTSRCYLKKKSGSRDLEASEIVLNSHYECAVRYENALNNELNGGTPNMRLIIANRIFTMVSFENVENKNRFFLFQLTEMQRG